MAAARLWQIRYRNVLSILPPQYNSFFHYDKPRRSIIGFCTQRPAVCSNSSTKDIEENAARVSGLKVYNALQKKGIHNYNETQVTLLYEFLFNAGVKPSMIEAQLIETPDLVKYSLGKWKNVFGILTKNGVPSDSVFKNVALYPDILQFNSNALNENVTRYSEMQIGKQSILQVVQRNPQLYVFPPKAIRRRMEMLSAIFPPTELKNLIKNNSNILTDDWNDVSEKFMYIHEEMGLEQPHIADCECLRKSMLHIKTRHQFLYRAGLYITPNLLRDKTSYKKNPPLSLIMDTSNKYFTNKIARLTDYEYDVFSNMMKEEHDYISDDDELSDSDVDSDVDSLN